MKFDERYEKVSVKNNWTAIRENIFQFVPQESKYFRETMDLIRIQQKLPVKLSAKNLSAP